MQLKERVLWHDTLTPTKVANEQPLAERVDVAVIGAGYTGLAAARALARRGARVAVLEAQSVGWGASSRNGGMVLTGMKKDVGTLLATYGREKTQRLFDTSLAAIDCVEQIVREEAIACDFARCGHLAVACKPAHFRALVKEAELLDREFGHRCEIVPPADLHIEIGSSIYHGGLVDTTSAGLNPARYVAGLASAAARAGAQIYEHTPVERVVREGGGFLLGTPRGALLASDVFVATNGYTSGVTPALHRRVIPIGSYIIATAPLPEALAQEVSPRNRMIFDTKHFLFYYRLTPDRRVLFGGRASFSQPTQTTVRESAAILQDGMLQVFPQLRGVPIEYAWGGTLGFTFDMMPHAGQLDGVSYALGYAGHGVALATYLGTTMGELLAGGANANPLADLAFPRAPLGLYNGKPWFLPFAGAWYRLLDWVG